MRDCLDPVGLWEAVLIMFIDSSHCDLYPFLGNRSWTAEVVDGDGEAEQRAKSWLLTAGVTSCFKFLTL